MTGRVLIVAGSDSGGGAGIQADIKAVTALGGFAMTAITALTAQNTRGVHGIHEVPTDFVSHQIEVVMDDLGADCIKTGMLHRRGVIDAVMHALSAHAHGVPIVVDPVMVAKGGASLLEDDAVAQVREAVLPRSTVITPNAPEAEVLTERSIAGPDDVIKAAEILRRMGAGAVLVKGGHVGTRSDPVFDVLIDQNGVLEVFESPRLDTPHTHGTGCTTASAIAAGVAQGLTVRDAVARARDYVHEAIRTAPGLGQGHGPLNHAHTVREGA